MAQDILNVVVEGPEEDAVFELYDDNDNEDKQGDDGNDDEVDQEALKEVIEILDDSD